MRMLGKVTIRKLFWNLITIKTVDPTTLLTNIMFLNVMVMTLVLWGTPTQEMVESYEDKNGNKVDWTEWHGTTKRTSL